jgi:hypothetical protein
LANYSLAAVMIPLVGKSFRNVHLHRFAIWLLISVFLFACQSTPTLKQKPVKLPSPSPSKGVWVPKWYAILPQLPGCQLAYAYSGVYIDAKRQKESLLKNGAANLAKSKQVELDVGWAVSQKNSYSQTASYIKEEEWQHQAESLEKDIKILSQFRLDRSILALVGLCSAQIDDQSLAAMLDHRLVKVSSKEPPAWVSAPAPIRGRLCGVGITIGYTTAAKAWQEAERQARADLAIRMAGQHNILERNMVQNGYAEVHNISETHAKLTLYNLKVIRHAYSPIGDTFYALVSIPTTTP